MDQPDPYPSYTRGERIADAVMHVLGVAFALTAGVVLIIWAAGHGAPSTIVGVSIYGAALIVSFVASAFYHFTPWERARPLLRRIDHAAIYLKIAGTYTPLVVLIGSAFSYSILSIVWALAAGGAAAKLFFWARPSRAGLILYLALGWLSVALFTSLWAVVSVVPMILIATGGILYTIGAVIFSLDGLRYQIAIWHGLVLAASACFFAAIAIGTIAAT